MDHHRWDGDFSAARNRALDLATSDWILYLDADERITVGPDEDDRAAMAHPEVVAGWCRFSAHPGQTRYWEPRLFRNHPEIRYEGRIHETMVGALHRLCERGHRIVRTAATIDHLGYVGDQTAKHHRNLPLLEAQRRQRGWKGFVLPLPNCTTVGLAISLKPLLDGFGLRRVLVTSLQGLSGAGRSPGVVALDIVDNVIPFIPKEEEKVARETAKILSRLGEGGITPLPVPVGATCTRVGVLEGHTLEFCYDLEQRSCSFWFPYATDDEDPNRIVGPGRTYKSPPEALEPGMAIAMVRLPGGENRDKGQVILEISPMGRVSPHEVVVVNAEHPDTEAMTVRINGLSNRAQVLKGDVTMETVGDADFQ